MLKEELLSITAYPLLIYIQSVAYSLQLMKYAKNICLMDCTPQMQVQSDLQKLFTLSF